MAAASSFAFASSDPDFYPTTSASLPVKHSMSSIHIHRGLLSVHPLVPWNVKVGRSSTDLSGQLCLGLFAGLVALVAACHVVGV
jgi:hypothetical protein